MSMVIPHEGEIVLLNNLLAGGALENWTLKLFSNNVTPALTDTSATYTVASFTGYADKTLTRTQSGSTWAAAAGTGSVLEASDAYSAYGASAQSWSATSSQTIYGYYILGATSGKVIAAEKFASAVNLINPSTITVQPSLELAT